MKKILDWLIFLLALIAFLFSGCKISRHLRIIKTDVWGSYPTCPPCCPTRTPTPTLAPNFTPTPEWTPTPTNEVTPTPTSELTPTPTPTLTPAPTSTSTPEWTSTPTPTNEVTPTSEPTPTPTPGNGGNGGNGGDEPTPAPLIDDPGQILGASVLGATGDSFFHQSVYTLKPLIIFPRASQPAKISLTKLGIELSILSVEVKDNDWQVPDNQPAYLKGSGLLGQAGNVVVYAHSQPQLFGRLKELQLSDEIWLTDQNGQEFIYQVVSQEVVSPQAVEILSSANESILTLYTCAGPNDSKRLVIKAKKVSV